MFLYKVSSLGLVCFLFVNLPAQALAQMMDESYSDYYEIEATSDSSLYNSYEQEAYSSEYENDALSYDPNLPEGEIVTSQVDISEEAYPAPLAYPIPPSIPEEEMPSDDDDDGIPDDYIEDCQQAKPERIEFVKLSGTNAKVGNHLEKTFECVSIFKYQDDGAGCVGDLQKEEHSNTTLLNYYLDFKHRNANGTPRVVVSSYNRLENTRYDQNFDENSIYYIHAFSESDTSQDNEITKDADGKLISTPKTQDVWLNYKYDANLSRFSSSANSRDHLEIDYPNSSCTSESWNNYKRVRNITAKLDSEESVECYTGALFGSSLISLSHAGIYPKSYDCSPEGIVNYINNSW